MQRARTVACQAAEMKAVLFDCDGTYVAAWSLANLARLGR